LCCGEVVDIKRLDSPPIALPEYRPSCIAQACSQLPWIYLDAFWETWIRSGFALGGRTPSIELSAGLEHHSKRAIHKPHYHADPFLDQLPYLVQPPGKDDDYEIVPVCVREVGVAKSDVYLAGG
jgi:hypothetical protein